jgi:hypothetical protein
MNLVITLFAVCSIGIVIVVCICSLAAYALLARNYHRAVGYRGEHHN